LREAAKRAVFLNPATLVFAAPFLIGGDNRRPDTPQIWAERELQKKDLTKKQRRLYNKIKTHDCEKDDVYTRFGSDWESSEKLAAEAQAAEAATIGVLGLKNLHGVSVTARPPFRPNDSSAP